MADKKISALSSASTPLAGTEVLPIVQGGATVKVAVADLMPGLNTVTVPKGGTGLTSVTANQIPYGNGTGALNTSSGLTFDGTNLLSTNNVNAYRDGWTAAIIAALTNTGGCSGGGPSTTFSSATYGGNAAQLFASSSTGTPAGFQAIVDSTGNFPTISVNCGNSVSVAWQSSIPSFWGRVYVRSAMAASFY